MTMLIDPDMGWMFGFPKPYDNPNDLPMDQWLIENGYPQKQVDYWKNSSYGSVPIRFIPEQEESE